jgi:hypothetical protein
MKMKIILIVSVVASLAVGFLAGCSHQDPIDNIVKKAPADPIVPASDSFASFVQLRATAPVAEVTSQALGLDGTLVPTIRILPEDINQDSIQIRRFSTNSVYVSFTYTVAGAKKVLAFNRENAGYEISTQVGTYESRGRLASLSAPPQGQAEEILVKGGAFSVREDDAKKIIAGLRGK